MPGCVAWNEHHSAVEFADVYFISFVNSVRQSRDSARVAFMGVNFQGVALQDAAIAAGVVVVMVRGQDMRQRPAPLFQGGGNGCGVRSIDRGCYAIGIVDQDAEIVR